MAARIVGWASKAEWSQVYQQLYSNDPVQVQHALDRAAAWKSRLDTKMPIAIDCTSSLLAVWLRDSGAHVRGEGGSSAANCHDLFQLRLAYSMALARFVNLVTDASQDKFYIQPVHVMAKEMSLPEWMVNLRHEATHRSLPALPVLRSGARFALSWLRKKYWEPQLQQCGELTGGAAQKEELDVEEVRQAVLGLLISYEQHQFEILSERSTRKQRTHHTTLLQEVLTNLAALMAGNSETVVSCLCGQGFLLPTPEQTTALGISNVFPENEGTGLPGIDKKFQDFWKPVFELLHQSSGIPPLVERLVQQLGTYTDEDLQFAVGWISLITTAQNSQDKKSLERLLQKVKVELPWRRLVTCCLATPCKHTTGLVHSMLQSADPPFSQHELQTYQHLCNIYTGNTAPYNQPVPESVFTADMAKARLQENQCKKKELETPTTQEDSLSVESVEGRTCLQYKAWEKCTDAVDWSQFPLGSIPNRTNDISYLEVPLGNSRDSRKQETPVRSVAWDTHREDGPVRPAQYDLQENHQRQDWTPMELGMLKRTVVLF
ncbi:PREDICTED: ribosomal biogenesis protein LAS1L-like [Branchiostoma belcheri]|uniref:Ribosomal biogenesis protein LAS1L-like n=1 Tax=Branchiostoma belcheri TaxID=7741 RepID=A0A6P5ABG4_BRABE|nr:PREDICTED: ribosomal biogenesis protein LAS1L-like [Branchiostoma belcheri]